jgi:predicted unusual protein kinase regulating ubiquinone biosynthesis (AarF/ABC1/UbiB family)
MKKARGAMPLSKLARAGVAGRLAVTSALRTLDPRKRSAEAEWEERGKDFFKACARLKGLPLKLAQMMSQEEELLPEEFRKELSKSCYQSPPMNRALVRRAVEANLGAPPEDLFREFSETPFAAASLGQVHRAVARDGRVLALKLQYPGIARTVRNDLALVGGIALGLPWLKEIEGAWKEVAERMLEELSYRDEARWTSWFRERLGIIGVTVPRVFPEFGSDTVLATEYMEGVHLDAWLADKPSQTDRDALAALLWRIYLRSVYELGAINADPNPGNYLIRRDAVTGGPAVALLDFGCVKEMPAGMGANLRSMFAKHARGKPAGGVSLVEEYAALGVLRITEPGRDFSALERRLRSMGEWVVKPYHGGVGPGKRYFDFGAAGDYFSRCRSEMWELFRTVKGAEFSPDFVFLDRARYGLYRAFQKLGARVDMANDLEGMP